MRIRMGVDAPTRCSAIRSPHLGSWDSTSALKLPRKRRLDVVIDAMDQAVAKALERAKLGRRCPTGAALQRLCQGIRSVVHLDRDCARGRAMDVRNGFGAGFTIRAASFWRRSTAPVCACCPSALNPSFPNKATSPAGSGQTNSTKAKPAVVTALMLHPACKLGLEKVCFILLCPAL